MAGERVEKGRQHESMLQRAGPIGQGEMDLEKTVRKRVWKEGGEKN